MDTKTVLDPAPETMPSELDSPYRPFVNAVPLSLDDIAGFRDKGYIKLSNLLTEDCTAALRAQALRQVGAAKDIGDTYGETFKRLTYGLGETEVFKSVYTSREFRKTLGSLTGTRLIVTEAQGFELSSDLEGFAWHYGSISFRFIRPQDMGYSIWVPLDPIDPNKQGGGLAYVSQNLLSAQSNFQISSLLSSKLVAGEPIDEISKGLFKVYEKSSVLMNDIFEKEKEEDSFGVGDAFLFNKNVWHRSSPLRKGPMKTRLAVNIRFIDWRSRLDTVMYHGESETGGGVGMGVNWGRQTQTTYGSQFTDIGHGDEIRDSRYCGPII